MPPGLCYIKYDSHLKNSMISSIWGYLAVEHWV